MLLFFATFLVGLEQVVIYGGGRYVIEADGTSEWPLGETFDLIIVLYVSVIFPLYARYYVASYFGRDCSFWHGS